MPRLLPILRTAALTIALIVPALPAAAAPFRLEPGVADTASHGPGASKGAVIWSHGRSLDAEDSEAPSPPYLRALREAGWDVFRFNRARVSDALPASSRALAAYAEEMKARGYRRVVLAGQSFGAFLSLMAAGRTDQVDAVIGTAPAAFGNYADSYDTWRQNASQLYAALREVRRADVMLFFFHGDDFDPGGRAERAQEILAERRIDHLVLDQPADLPGHGAAGTGLFVRRFGACIARFIEPTRQEPVGTCEQAWGRVPSASLPMPELRAIPVGGVGMASVQHPFAGRWYGYYVNGRELMLSIDSVEGDRVRATYALGPGIEPGHAPERTVRRGRIVGNELIFDEPGLNRLRFSIRSDGKLAGTWSAIDGEAQLATVLRRVY